MIKSIKLANSYPTSVVGFIAKDLSNLYNLGFKLDFSTIILNSLFEELIADNSIKNKISSLMQNLKKESQTYEIKETCESIRKSILECTFPENLDEYINDAYETLSWGENTSAKDLLKAAEHRVDIIASPDYITAPIIYSGIDKEKIKEKIKEIYAEFFTYTEVIYRINSDIKHEFSIGLIIKKEETISASAFVYLDKPSNLIKLFVFPGRLNIKEVINPDEEVKPDYYEINRDTLKLKNSLAGKQKFKNICENGECKRVECQINSFILDDNAAIEIARLTKKASVLLEKDVQIIFSITSNKIEIEHVSNIIDLQKDYVQKSQEIATGTIEPEAVNSIPEETEEQINENLETGDTFHDHEPIKELDEEPEIEPIQEGPNVEEEIHNEIPKIEEPQIEEVQTTQERTIPVEKEAQPSSFEEIMKSEKSLNELMREEGAQKEIPVEEKSEPRQEEKINFEETPLEEKHEVHSEFTQPPIPVEEERVEVEEPVTEDIKEEPNILDSNPISILDEPEEKKEESEEKKDDDDFIL